MSGPDDPTEMYEQGDDAIDEARGSIPDSSRSSSSIRRSTPTTRSTHELEEAGAELDDPEQIAALDGLIDDPDGGRRPVTGTPAGRPTPRGGTSTHRWSPATPTTTERLAFPYVQAPGGISTQVVPV